MMLIQSGQTMERVVILLAAMMFACAQHAACAAGQTASRFVPDRFVIGIWNDPPADDRMAAHYAELAAANFNFVIGTWSANTPELVERQLAICHRYGLKCTPHMPEVPMADYPDGPACWGYLLTDEPSASEFSELRQRVDKLRQLRPGRLAYINLFPEYVGPANLGTDTYDEYVRRFVDEVDVDVLSMDHYPQMQPGADWRDSYCLTLEAMRKHSVRKGIPFWNLFNSMPQLSLYDPTESQLRWQIFTSLAYGAKGVMYFCYWTPVARMFQKGGAIIHADGRRSRHYYQAKRINAMLRRIGPTLMKLTCTGVRRVPVGVDSEPLLAGHSMPWTWTSASGVPVRVDSEPLLGGCPITNITVSRDIGMGDSADGFLIGTFRHEDGRRAVMLNNYDYIYTAWPTVEFDTDVAMITELDQLTGREIPVYDDSPTLPGLQLSLDSGAGRLFLMRSDG